MTDRLPSLFAAVESRSFTIETLKALRNLCAGGLEIQNAIRDSVAIPLFPEFLNPGSPFFITLLELANNLCVDNPDSQHRLFPLIAPSFSGVSWTIASATS
jgi:hypothetical protein